MVKKKATAPKIKDEEPRGSAMLDFYENLEPFSLYAARSGITLPLAQEVAVTGKGEKKKKVSAATSQS